MLLIQSSALDVKGDDGTKMEGPFCYYTLTTGMNLYKCLSQESFCENVIPQGLSELTFNAKGISVH